VALDVLSRRLFSGRSAVSGRIASAHPACWLCFQARITWRRLSASHVHGPADASWSRQDSCRERCLEVYICLLQTVRAHAQYSLNGVCRHGLHAYSNPSMLLCSCNRTKSVVL
jgi:hypothetical protein